MLQFSRQKKNGRKLAKFLTSSLWRVWSVRIIVGSVITAAQTSTSESPKPRQDETDVASSSDASTACGERSLQKCQSLLAGCESRQRPNSGSSRQARWASALAG